MKRFFILLLICSLLTAPALASKPITIGVLIYNTADTFMMSIAQEIRNQADESITLLVRNGANSQDVQMRQVEEMISHQVDALIINAVDRTAALFIIKLCKKADIPVVFINREPLREDMELYDKAYYVGTQPRQQGQMCGELMADYFKSHPQADKNGDGRVQYVLLKGEPGHQDAEERTTHSVKALEDAGLKPMKLAEEDGGWEKGRGQQIMAAFLSEFGDSIECVLSNNDDMALGAIDALKAAGYFSDGRIMPVVGVDATAPAREALKQGTLIGTVLNDAVGQGVAALHLARLLARGEAIVNSALPFPLRESRFVWVPGQKIVYEAQKGFPGI